MKIQDFIPIDIFCKNHNVEEPLIMVLHQYDLFKIEIIKQQVYVHKEELPLLEKVLHMHDELGINPEGIETIQHLLKKIVNLQNELHTLKNKLDRFEY